MYLYKIHGFFSFPAKIGLYKPTFQPTRSLYVDFQPLDFSADSFGRPQGVVYGWDC